MSKEVFFGKENMEKMVKGLDTIANAIGQTIGPKGRNVFIGDPQFPKIINDGASIAARISLEDKQEEAGAYVIRNVAGQQNDDVGDGTTTVTVLTQAIIHECLARPENPMEIRESLHKASQQILKKLAKRSIKIDKKDIEKVALISTENKELAKLITEIVNKLGEKAVINVEDSKTFATDYEIVDGYEAHVGFMSPKFITDPKTARAVYKDIAVFATEKKISKLADIAPLFNSFAFKTDKDGKILTNQMGMPTPHDNPITECVIFCEDIDDTMLGMFVANYEQKKFNLLVIRATSLLLQDIAGYVGVKAVSDTTGVTFQNVKREHLGFAKKIICDANKTVIMGDGKSHLQYLRELESKAEGEPNMYTQKNMQQRIAKLRGGVAVLRIGASTDGEREYLKPKAEDGIKAVQAALAEGVVEGGGITLWRLSQEIKGKSVGEQIMKKALTAPLRKIIENAGKDYTEILLNAKGQGYDAKNDTYVDMIKAGIIDPTKVERCAIENAVGASGIFITTGCSVVDYVEPHEKN